jgi:hypothetical protein
VADRTRDAIRTAPALTIAPREYAQVIERIDRLLKSGDHPIDASNPLSRLELFCLWQDFDQPSGVIYRKTKHWIKKSFLQRGVRACCERCGMTNENEYAISLDAHHLHYGTVGSERIEVDLMTLCRWCHDLEHDRLERRFVLGLLVPRGGTGLNDDEIPFLEPLPRPDA